MSKIRIRIARKFVPHTMLLEAASRALESAKGKTEGQWWDWLATLLYCSLSIEAIGNSYGETTVPNWKEFESASPIAKILLVAERSGLQPDFGKQPWGLLREMITFRNKIAHARMEEINIDESHPQDDWERHFYNIPQSKLERLVTAKFAERSLQGIYDILGLFANGPHREAFIQLEFAGTSGSAGPD